MNGENPHIFNGRMKTLNQVLSGIQPHVSLKISGEYEADSLAVAMALR